MDKKLKLIAILIPIYIISFGLFLNLNLANVMAQAVNPPYCPVKVIFQTTQEILPNITQTVSFKVTAIREGSACPTNDHFIIGIQSLKAGTADSVSTNVDFGRRYSGGPDREEKILSINMASAPRSGEIIFFQGAATIVQDATFYDPLPPIPKKVTTNTSTEPEKVRICFVSCTTAQPTGIINPNPTPPPTTNPPVSVDIPKIDNPTKAANLAELISKAINILLSVIAMVSVIMIIVSGFRMVAYGGNPTELGKAKAGLIWAILGLVIAVMSFSIVSIITRLVR
jgi:hypothetical protein